MSGLGGIGGFTPSAIKQFQQNLFHQIDLSGSGSASKTELEQAGGGTQAADALFSLLDPNNSGGVSEPQRAQALPGSGLSDQMHAQMIGYQAQGWPGASPAQPGGQLARDLFSQIDRNGSGAISKTDLEQAVIKAGGSKEAADALYAKLDPKGSGSVSEQQFAQVLFGAPPHHRHHHAGGTGDSSAADALASLFNADGGGAANSPLQIAQNIFSKIDRNGDGAITKSELEQAVTAAGGDKAGADALYAKLDPNGTGSVSEQQFIDALQPPLPTGTSAQDALLALITGSGGSSGDPAATATAATFSHADLARAFSLYQSHQLLSGISLTQSAGIA
jgi:Ca2+-binding EF-hand superfamily protein